MFVVGIKIIITGYYKKMNNILLPAYVSLGIDEITMRLINECGIFKYYRDSGDWSVLIKVKNNAIYSHIPHASNYDNIKLIPTSKCEYEKDNKGFISIKVFDLLIKANQQFGYDDYINIWGKHLGHHIWFQEGTDLIKIWSGGLTKENKQSLVNYILNKKFK